MVALCRHGASRIAPTILRSIQSTSTCGPRPELGGTDLLPIRLDLAALHFPRTPLPGEKVSIKLFVKTCAGTSSMFKQLFAVGWSDDQVDCNCSHLLATSQKQLSEFVWAFM